MHAIAKYWPQSVKEVPKSWTKLDHRNYWDIHFHLRVIDSTKLECARSVIIH